MTDTQITTRTPAVQALADSLGKPSLHALSYALRHPETWPKGFVWDFNNWDGCAMALAHVLWSDGDPVPKDKSEENDCWREWVSIWAKTFGVSFSDVQRMFYGTEWTSRPKTFLGIEYDRTPKISDWSEITPEMVADEIDRYLATAE
jgi:hypothetical protein